MDRPVITEINYLYLKLILPTKMEGNNNHNVMNNRKTEAISALLKY